jgi:hypothetical protein
MMDDRTDPLPSNPDSSSIRTTTKEDESFSEVVGLIVASRERAVQAVNTALIELYWKISVKRGVPS